MRLLFHRLTVDNSVISALQEADALIRVFEFWPGTWVIPEQIRDEARAWRRHGRKVLEILDNLSSRLVVEITSIDPLTEGAMLRTLTRALGQGEAAAIAIAACRGYSVALDDLRARRACDALVPPVSWISTEGILGVAVTEGLLSRREAEQIWTGTGISDPSRFVP